MRLFILKALAFILGHLPQGVATLLGKVLGRLIYIFDKNHRKTALDNLERAYGQTLPAEEKARIAKKVFEHIAVTFLEFMRMPWMKAADLDKVYEVEGLEHLERALTKKRGVIILTAHMGNWEYLGNYFGLTGKPIDEVVRDPDNAVFEEFVKWARTRSGNTVVPKRKAMRRLLTTLSRNGLVGILLDQNVADYEGVFVDFFGTKACTNKGPALLAIASKAAVVPTYIIRKGAKHRVIFKEEMNLKETGDRERDALENTAAWTAVIEETIRACPEQWFWVHRRWKTRPANRQIPPKDL